MANHQTTIIVLFSGLTVAISMGLRQSFGLFMQPVSQGVGLGREVFSLAMALQNLIFGLPLLGIVADRYGARWVVLGGAVLYAIGCLLVPTSGGPVDLYLTLGLIIGLGLSSTTYVVLFGGRRASRATRAAQHRLWRSYCRGVVWDLCLSARGAMANPAPRVAGGLPGDCDFSRGDPSIGLCFAAPGRCACWGVKR